MTNPAEGYETYMVPALFGPWAARLVEAARPQPGERILDVGCGTGVVARQIAAALKQPVTAVDVSAQMLEVARESADREGVQIDWRQTSAEELPFPDDSFDLIISQFALMFFVDRSAALREMRRLVKHSGRVLLSVWQGLDSHPFYQQLHEVIQRRVGISALQQIFALGSQAELRELISGSGFMRIEIEPTSMRCRFPHPSEFLAGEIELDTAAIPAMQHLDDTARRFIVAAIANDMQEPLTAVTIGDCVALDFHAHIVCARA